MLLIMEFITGCITFFHLIKKKIQLLKSVTLPPALWIFVYKRTSRQAQKTGDKLQSVLCISANTERQARNSTCPSAHARAYLRTPALIVYAHRVVSMLTASPCYEMQSARVPFLSLLFALPLSSVARQGQRVDGIYCSRFLSPCAPC